MGSFPLFPVQASSFSAELDAIFWVTTALTAIFTSLASALILFFVLRYRAGSNVNRKNAPHENKLIEVLLLTVPLVLGLAMFFWNARLFAHMRRTPKDAMDLYVIGKQWMWHLQHPDGTRENNELHVPVGKPVKLVMISQDVLHSFFIPEFRIKQDVLPGRYTYQWFTATKPGKYRLLCTEYCGTQHSEMGGYVYAMDPAEYERWLSARGERDFDKKRTMAEAGEALFKQYGCGTCHTAKDTHRGPTLVGLVGTKRTLSDGTTSAADLPYLREAILRPNDRLTKGYLPSMPTYAGQVSEAQTLQLIEYIRGLGPEASAKAKPASAATTAASTGTQR
jgi:cytochrome c oxidase subunit 2